MSDSIDSVYPGVGTDLAPRRRQWLWWGLVVVWMGIIFYFSAQSIFDFVPKPWQIDPVSWAVHFGEYAVLALLLWQALRHTPRLSHRASSLALALAVLYAISDEWHQSFVPGRYPDVRDVLVDAAGALSAVLLLRWRSQRPG